MRYQVDESGCWVWAQLDVSTGYGKLGHAYAHRLSYELFVGPILSGQTVHHRCGNRACVNPEHLEPMLLAEHARLHNARAKWTHCPKGHPFDVANTYITPSGARRCRACHARRERLRVSAAR